ncbi:hypothetical protein QFC19_003628 [Naganishia cerealis]|uniref:Uncharacterized protein n=1 Tax=Naganishia cerealis TaxID=610337 RepID=A0ACC2W1B7_9TREE|nr:hypothetical protein QFC19_003628 [Naganishia cerealis]
MNVIKAQAALLSDLEVLKIFQEQHEENRKITEAISEQKAQLKAKQDNDLKAIKKYAGAKPVAMQEQKNLAIRGVTEDILFVTEQVTNYFSGPLSVAKRQTTGGIQNLMQGLVEFNLTKTEELQIINLAPRKLIELYLIIDEVDIRLSEEQQQDLIDLIERSLEHTGPDEGNMTILEDPEELNAEYDAINDEEHAMHWDEQGGDLGEEEAFFAESKWGGGAGIEDEGDGAIDE